MNSIFGKVHIRSFEKYYKYCNSHLIYRKEIDLANEIGWSNLKFLPDISKWDTSKVVDMSYMFLKCSKIESLPNISKWNTINLKIMTGMFALCSSLSSLPDISKWNADNVINMSFMFFFVNP